MTMGMRWISTWRNVWKNVELNYILNMAKKVMISEKQFRGLCGSERKEFEMMIPITYDNPLTIFMCCDHINEGLVKTYPFETMKRYVCQYFNIYECHFHEYDANGVKCVAIDVPKKPPYMLRLVSKAMNLCGYFPSQSMELDDYVRVHFEPKFQEKTSYDGDFLYHVTHHMNVPKIQSIGLCPTSKNKRFNYGDRIYLFSSDVPREVLEWFASKVNVCQGRDKFQKEKNKRRDELFCVLKIKNDNSFTLHDDSNMDYGLWTNDNISPDCIIDVVETINASTTTTV